MSFWNWIYHWGFYNAKFVFWFIYSTVVILDIISPWIIDWLLRVSLIHLLLLADTSCHSKFTIKLFWLRNLFHSIEKTVGTLYFATFNLFPYHFVLHSILSFHILIYTWRDQTGILFNFLAYARKLQWKKSSLV